MAVSPLTMRDYADKLSALPKFGLGLHSRIISTISMKRECERRFYSDDPVDQALSAILKNQIAYIDFMSSLIDGEKIRESIVPSHDSDNFKKQDDQHIFLFNKHWQTLSIGDKRNELSPWIGLIRERLRVNNLDASYFAGKRAIDVGCGSGRFSFCMAMLGATVDAVDPGADSISHGRRIAEKSGLTQKVRFTEGSAYQLPFDDAEFDFAVCNGVLHHLDNPEAALKEINRVMKPNGQFWLYTEGSGGLFHEMWDIVYDSFVGIPQAATFQALEEMQFTQTIYWMDWFYAKYHCKSDAEMRKMLTAAGFDDIKAMHGARTLDCNATMFEDKPEFNFSGKFGDGSLRLLMTKIA